MNNKINLHGGYKVLKKSDIHSFPKAELHCHLDGSIRPETLQKIAKTQGLSISDDVAEVSSHMQAPPTCQNLVEYLTCFDFVLPYLQTKEALEMAAFDVMEQAAEDGIRYIEIRFAPSLSMEKGLSVEEIIESVAKGVADAEAQYNVHGNLLVIGMKTGELALIESIFSKTLALKNEKVVGFDLAGAEEDHFIDDYSNVLKVVTDSGEVPLTLHAGECGCVHNVFSAIKSGAKRIGHGIALKGKIVEQQELANHDVCIEGCPTSNVQTRAINSFKDYPLREWLENDVTFCINTDNKTVSNTTLSKEYDILRENFELTPVELCQLNKNAMTYSFAEKALKEKILNEMDTYSFS